jgi:hypothetical protein
MAGITPAISVFMFGNVYDGIFGKGVTGVKVINSYFECVDSYNSKFINIMIRMLLIFKVIVFIHQL